MDKATGKSFNFVNLTHPDELKDEGTQARIRRLAMTEFGKTRRRPKTKRARNEIILEFRDVPSDRQIQQQLLPTSFDRWRNASVDPFASYPIELDDVSRELVVNVFLQDSVHIKALRDSWFTVGLYDPAPFYGLLSNSLLSIHIRLHGVSMSSNDPKSLRLYTKAIRLVQERMRSPGRQTDGTLIGAVSSFMCHDASWYLKAFDTWNTHRSAMLKLIDLKGGADAIFQEALRITVSWCELGGTFAQDIPPKLPLPRRWEANAHSPPGSPRPYSHVSLLWKQRFPMRLEWITILDDVTQLISLDRAFTSEQFAAVTQTGSWLEPTLVRLLRIRPMETDSGPGSVMEEVCRLGTLLFLSPVWRYMGVKPVWTDSFTRNLLAMLNNCRVDWGELKPLLVWTLYFAAIETADLEERKQFTVILAMLMKAMKIQEWEGVLQIVKFVLWIEPVFKDSDNNVRDEIFVVLSQTLVPESATGVAELQDA
ncbi:hypothetical protein K491DRAFT_611420 [Lophiostoma macrostomum CBS 122681]|uniref:Tachykinin family protein n=1 Tax=Lophiostoma macrostomum CBS 122681 TaxID=1314788 RepID=A0A6A6SQ78_9PLEO|nr:hypothetical protein K491DRAFT_611420 [Lophiostoma macrostomum CBS 122681]